MPEYTKTFTLARARSAQGGVTDASGWTGRWPFRRRLSYHVGVNCDSITQSEGRLYVRRRGWTIAVAELRPVPAIRWSALLHSRHAAKGSPWAW